MRFQTVSMTTPVIRLIRMGAFEIEVQSQTHQALIKSTGLRRYSFDLAMRHLLNL